MHDEKQVDRHQQPHEQQPHEQQSHPQQSLSVAERSVPLAASPNMRDVGGLATRDGRQVKRGVTFRSGELSKLDEEQIGVLAALGITRVLDLRTDDERAKGPDRLPQGVPSIHLDVLGDTSSGRAAAGAGGAGPADASSFDDMTKPGAMEGMYRDLVSAGSARKAYRAMFEELAAADGTPVLFHCTGGRDRAGWAAASLQTLLGVSRQDVTADYLASNERLDAYLTKMLEPYAARGADVAKIKQATELRPAFLDAAFQEIDARYGSFEGYLTEGLGLSDTTLATVRAAHLQA
ncbi:tyrosine-protein phosphatase [Streptomyces sp. NBC_01304]|uniref:tyrosine-protein phosphatase n=1 Tax=Streptomyces sp. NBC_01304 TaxID=2903818 RepID=UPI002E129C3D|nr:tyrosine-protein phosphatase [Streptomyces sp. NBC_01304]